MFQELVVLLSTMRRLVIVTFTCVFSTITLIVIYSTLGTIGTIDDAVTNNAPLLSNVPVLMRYAVHSPESTGENETLVLQSERSFNISPGLLASIGFPLDLSGVTSLTESGFDQFVFVTASSGNHFHENMDAIASVQEHFPNHTLYYYDLDTGMPAATVLKLKALCNVVYRVFDYSRYPSHVKVLHTYAFKPLIVHEVLREHKTVFWIDSSIRFNGNMESNRRQVLNESRGVLMFDYTGHSIFAATHETMYKYIVMSKPAAVNVSMMGANAIYMHCSQELYNAVIRWWVMCALEPNCIAPTRDLYCRFNGRDHYANCHRYDQSALSILLGNYFDNDFAKYTSKTGGLSVMRESSNMRQLRVCQQTDGSISLSIKSKSYF